jgi:hypothetical protein
MKEDGDILRAESVWGGWEAVFAQIGSCLDDLKNT